MGLFSSKKKIKVGTSIQRMVEDTALPDTATVSLIDTVLTHSRTEAFGENLVKDFASSLAIRVPRAYRWANANSYPFGLPTCYLGSANQGQGAVKAVIEAEVGTTILVDYFFYGSLNRQHAGYVELQNAYGYVPRTNELTLLSATYGYPVYLKKAVPVYPPSSHEIAVFGEVDQWEPNTSSLGNVAGLPSNWRSLAHETAGYIVDETATEEYLEVTWFYKDSANVEHTGTFTVSLAAYANPSEYEDYQYFHVKYHYTADTVEHVGYWIYRDESGTYPTIDAVHQDEYTTLGAFYPWIHFRDGTVNKTADDQIGTADYIAQKHLCKILDLDFQALGDAIHENPDIHTSKQNVEQAMLILAVSMDTTHQEGLRYLFDFFTRLTESTVDDDGVDYRDLTKKVKGYTPAQTGKVIVIKDRDFSMTLSYSLIQKKLRTGSVAEVGKYAGMKGTTTEQKPVQYRSSLGVITVENEPVTGEYYYFRKQITPQIYEEVRVYGLELSYHIYADKSYRAGYGADELLIPLDHSIVGNYSLPVRERLYAMSMHFVFNSKVVIKIKWYQQGWFKAVLIIAAIVWAVYTRDFTKLAALLAEQGIQAVVVEILINIVTGMVIQMGLEYLAQLTGAEWAVIIASVAAMAAGYATFKSGSLKGVPWAEDLLKASIGLVRGAEKVLLGDFKELAKDYKAFEDYKDNALAELERGRDLLTTHTVIDPFEFIAMEPFFVIGEQPWDYFGRTVESGNIGMQSIKAISSYVPNALRLPTLSETEGAFYDAVSA